MTRKIIGTVVMAALIYSLCTRSTYADPIFGAIGFTGSGSVMTSAGSTTVTFNNPLLVDIRVGAWNAIPFGTPANFAPIAWTGSGFNAVLTSSNAPEWSIYSGGTGYLFSVLTVSNAIVTPAAFLVTGVGLAVISGAITRDPTYFFYSVEGHLDLQGNSSDLTFTIGPNSGGAPSVPESGSSAFALLGVGLIALDLFRRRWCTKA